MRRLVAAFKKDKPSKEEPPPPPPTLAITSSSLLAPHRSSSPALSRPSLVQSDATRSTCSSELSGTSQPRTPDNDEHKPSPGFSSWLSRRKSKKKPPSTLTLSNDSQTKLRVPVDRSMTGLVSHGSRTRLQSASRSASLPSSRTPRTGRQIFQVESSASSESEDSASASDAEGVPSEPSTPHVTPLILQKARKRLYEFTIASLVPAPTPPPLLQLAQQSFNSFPRSMMTPTSIPHSRSSGLLPSVHKKQLLRRLETTHLTMSEEQSIAPFARPANAIFLVPPKMLEAVPNSKQLVPFSPGIRQWTSRPCYEERSSLWYLDEADQLTLKNIPGPKAAVAALEFSEAIECLAGNVREDVEANRIPTEGIIDARSPLSVQMKDTLPRLHIQPIAQEARDASSSSTVASTPSPCTPPPSISKRGVRFNFKVEEADEDDLVPLAVTIQARRELEARKHQLEERERRMIEESVRKQREAEERVRVEARNRKLYAEEVVASRRRREAHRTGFKPEQGHVDLALSESKQTGRTIRPVYDKRHSSSSNASISDAEIGVSNSRGSSRSHSRPTSYGSSGDDSPVRSHRNSSRASSSSSIAGVWPEPRPSPAASSEDVSIGRRKPSRSPDPSTTPRSRKLSDRSKRSSQQDIVPPVPFLARDWQVQDMPIPPEHLMQQGPFMASVRSQKYTTLKASHSTDRVDSLSPMPHLSRPSHPKHYSEQDTTTRATMSYSLGNRNSILTSDFQHPRAFDPGRRGTVIF